MTPLINGLVFPECPRWHDGALWFSDMHARIVYCVDSAGRVQRSFEVPGKPGGLGWLPDGDMLVVSMEENRVYRFSENGLSVHAALGEFQHRESNDMVLDDRGNAYIGNMGFDFLAGEPIARTNIVRVDPTGEVSLAADGLLCPNGMVLSPDARTLIVAETFGSKLTAFTVGEHGYLSERRTFARLGKHAPDGICIDAEQCIWVAACVNQECLRINPAGDVVDRIHTGSLNPFACALGGKDGRRLFICCAVSSDPTETGRAMSGTIAFVDVPVGASG